MEEWMLQTILRIETIIGAPVLDHGKLKFPLSCFHRTIVVPMPYQAGVEDNMVVYISQGRWAARRRYPICPLEHPIDCR